MKEILFTLLNDYADWEAGPLAAALHQKEGFCVKTASLSKQAVRSLGGFSTLPDYDLGEACQRTFSGLILIGGSSWRTQEARQVEALVKYAVKRHAVIAAISDASVFLGAMGLLNNVAHTSNRPEDLQRFAGSAYTNAAQYQNPQAVRSGGIVTANGTASLEFGREVLIALGAMSDGEAKQWYDFYKLGYWETARRGALPF